MKRILLLPFFILIVVAAVAQKPKKAPYPSMKSKGTAQSKFLDKQFWLGFKAGVNLTQPDVMARYSVLAPTNYATGQTDKTYKSFSMIGSQATLEFTFAFKNISISAQPTYRSSQFAYSNEFNWTGNTASQRLNLQFNQEQKLDYADLPLLVKYEVGSGSLRPHLQFGVYYSILINANKSVTVSGTDNASGGSNSFQNEPVVVGAKDLFTNSWGLMGGAGLSYQLGNVRIVFDALYYKGMSNIANVNNRFSNDRLSGIGDAQDDLKTNHLVFQLGCLFPLRFLSNEFKSLD